MKKENTKNAENTKKAESTEVVNLCNNLMTVSELTAYANKAFDTIGSIDSGIESSTLMISYLLQQIKANNCHYTLVANAKDKGKYAKYAISELEKRGIHYKRASVNMLSRVGEYVALTDGKAHTVWSDGTNDFKSSIVSRLLTGFNESTTDEVISIVANALETGAITLKSTWKDIEAAMSALPEWNGKKPEELTGETTEQTKGEQTESEQAEGEQAEGEQMNIDKVDISQFTVQQCCRQAVAWLNLARKKDSGDDEELIEHFKKILAKI